MPELPEVETLRTYLYPYLINKKVENIIIRHHQLRYRVRHDLPKLLNKQRIIDLVRRGKYMVIEFHHGRLLIHLGMSGTLRLLDKQIASGKHDHIDLIFDQHLVRYNDPRRFGCCVWETDQTHRSLLDNLGYEPLVKSFNRHSLYKITSTTKMPIKSLLMTNQYVTGIGNIYANESLWLASISPLRPSNQLSLDECSSLVHSIKKILRAAIKQGGTSIRDYQTADGSPGYFYIKLNAYGKSLCRRCQSTIKRQVLGQRSTFYCPNCQQ